MSSCNNLQFRSFSSKKSGHCKTKNQQKNIIWLVVSTYPSEKYDSQLGWFSQYMEKWKMFQTTNQVMWSNIGKSPIDTQHWRTVWSHKQLLIQTWFLVDDFRCLPFLDTISDFLHFVSMYIYIYYYIHIIFAILTSKHDPKIFATTSQKKKLKVATYTTISLYNTWLIPETTTASWHLSPAWGSPTNQSCQKLSFEASCTPR